jgi:SAM-dependent methyltransferase
MQTDGQIALDLEMVGCPCGSFDLRLHTVLKGWQICQCKLCGLLYINPRPSEQQMDALYDALYFDARQLQSDVGAEAIRAGVISQNSRVDLIERYHPKGRLLDVGCASGYFLACAEQRGWATQGVEISAWAAYRAQQLIQGKIWLGNMESALPKTERFDVVTMWHVLEHIRNPIDILSAVKELLTPDGILVVQVPNVVSLDARLSGEKWSGWDLPFHLYHFTPASLCFFLRRSGFVIRALRLSPSVWLDKISRRLPYVQKLSWFAEIMGALSRILSGRHLTVMAHSNGIDKD